MWRSVAGSLLRRSFNNQRDPAEPIEYQMPLWGIVLMVSTFLLFVGLNFMIEYTYGHIIPTLLMIESPSATLFEPIKSDDPDAKVDSQDEEGGYLVQQAPITSSFCSTMKHLRSKAGKLSRFRGLSMYFVAAVMVHNISHLVSLFLPSIFAPLIAMVLSTPFYLAWTHIVISNPSPLRWYKRMPTREMVKKAMVPTAHYALAKELTVMLPAYLAKSYGILEMKPEDCLNMTKQEVTLAFGKALSVLALAAALAFAVLIPARVILTRVQASLLPESEETIVPFDRSFAGAKVPEVVGGTGAIGILDAWRTFDRNSRVRLLKTYAKVFAMEIALGLVFCTVLLGEIFVVVGKGNLDQGLKRLHTMAR